MIFEELFLFCSDHVVVVGVVGCGLGALGGWGEQLAPVFLGVQIAIHLVLSLNSEQERGSSGCARIHGALDLIQAIAYCVCLD